MKFAIILCAISISVQQNSNTCPTVTYDENKSIWYGELIIHSSNDLFGIHVDILFDSLVDVFEQTTLHKVTTADRKEYHITNNNYKLNANKNLHLPFNVKYSNSRIIPLIKEVRLNGRPVCTTYSEEKNPSSSNPLNTDRSNININRNTNSNEKPPSVTSTTSRRFEVTDNVYGIQRVDQENLNNARRITTTPTRRAQSTSTSSWNLDHKDSNDEPESINKRRESATEEYFFDSDSRPSITTTTKRNRYFEGDIPVNRQETTTHYILSANNDDICGTIVPKTTPLIVSGERSYHGQFPWHAALYRTAVSQIKYICGGSLISKKIVITAAHCVTKEGTTSAINNSNLLIYFGKYNLGKWSGPEQDGKVSQIIVHPKFDYEKFYSDIAILKMRDNIEINNYVRPVCLWNFDTDLKVVIGKNGQVPGFGFNENGFISETLSYVDMPVVTHEQCIWSNREFFSRVTSDTSYCAGFNNGSSVCNGDSGGGMVFKYNNKWYIRGIVSIGLALQNHFTCDPNHYAVFTDVAKFIDWIKQI